MSQEVEEDGFRVTRAMGVYLGRDLELYVVNPFYDPRLTVRIRSSLHAQPSHANNLAAATVSTSDCLLVDEGVAPLGVLRDTLTGSDWSLNSRSVR